MAKEICKTCQHCKPSYKCGICELTGRKVKTTKEGCEQWRPK